MKLIAGWEEAAAELVVKLANTPSADVQRVLAVALREEYGRGYNDGYNALQDQA